MNLLGSLIVRHKTSVIVSLALITAGLIASLPGIRIENDQSKYSLPEEEAVVKNLERFEDLFGSRVFVVIAIEMPNGLSKTELSHIERLTQRIDSLSGVAKTFSVANAQRIYWDPFKPVTGPLYGRSATDDTALVARLLEFVRSEPVYKDNLLSEDGRLAAVIVELDQVDGPDRAKRENEVGIRIQQVVFSEMGESRVAHFTGMPYINLAFQKNIGDDIGTFGLLSLVAVVVVLVLLFREWKAVALALLCAGLSLVWSLGVLTLSGAAISVALAMMIPLVIVVSIAYSIHYLVHFFGDDSSATSVDPIAQTMSDVFVPSFITGVTTSIGFFSLLTSGLEGIREVGLFLGLSILCCLVINNVFLPAALAHLSPHTSNRGIRTAAVSVAGSFSRLVEQRGRTIILTAFLVSLLSVLGALRLTQDANHLRYFKESEPIRAAYEIVDGRLGGAIPIEITVTRPEDQLDGIIPRIDSLVLELRRVDGIGNVVAPSDYIRMAEHSRPSIARVSLSVTQDRFPEQFWDSLEESDVGKDFISFDDDSTTFRVAARARVQGSEGLTRLLGEVQGLAAAHLSGEVYNVTGELSRLVRTQAYVINTQMASFGLAFLIVLLLVSLVARSLRTGAVAMIANVVPVLGVLGIMGWFKIPLDLSTTTIASVAIGIVVDDTIHFLYHFRSGGQSATGPSGGIQHSFKKVSVALVVTSLVLVGGFLSMLPSNFEPTRYFGLLSALVVGFALVADLLLLPALLNVFEKERSV